MIYKTESFDKWANEGYEQIYISIGGKINEETVAFDKRMVRSNALFQMIPNFIRVSKKKVLVIIVDDFHRSENYSANVREVEKIIASSQYIDVIFLDNRFTLSTIKSIIISIIEFAIKLQIQPQNYMCCNYVRFSHPNEKELIMEQLPKILHEIHTETPFSEGFYQWHGYQFYLYNTVYCYKRFHFTFIHHYHSIFDMIRLTMKDMQLSFSNASMLKMMEFNGKLDKILDVFLKDNYDITCYYIDSEIASPYNKAIFS